MYKDEIKNIRWRIKESNGYAVIDFEFFNRTFTITEPQDVVLDDNDASKQWIINNYGFLLAPFIPEGITNNG